ncbi:nickel-dependent hydrogenase large subunit [Pseudalkalibacillus sp. R45]|uniref:nickel-dependent hydrogenase large subunit n=1 Tax=Pseudalkalibacillus sp. R45 TaxID=3457433 RepID=UPI003FCE64F6
MARRIVINPLTRISGFLEIDVKVEKDKVVDALTKGMFFRGFEQMMVGRNPFDAIYLTQRICGICSCAHSVASSLALEDALDVQPSEQGRYLRDFIHGCEFLQNHLRHFYQYSLPDYVKMPADHPLYSNDHEDYRLSKELNNQLVDHYFKSLPISRLAHQMLAVFGGKAPHNHGIFVGGFSTPASTDKIIKAKSILKQVKEFIETVLIPDTYIIADHYPELFQLGKGPGNLMSVGAFNDYEDLGTLYTKPLVYMDGKIEPFNEAHITEKIDHSWYEGKESYRPLETISDPDMEKSNAYTWVKAPRYKNRPFEVGPLARLWLSGEYRNGISAMDRTIARSFEAKKVAEIMTELLNQIIPNVSVQEQWQVPDSAEGTGLVETTRGSLGHWVKIDQKMLSFYQIITPSAWDFSATDKSTKGTAEQAVIGTPVMDADHPVELGRILRSFDPCMSCATHVYRPGKETKTIKVL